MLSLTHANVDNLIAAKKSYQQNANSFFLPSSENRFVIVEI